MMGRRARRLAPLLLLAAAFALAGALLPAGAGTGTEPVAASSHWTDYDTDDNGLIEVDSLAKLDAIRHDLDGDGVATHADYASAFPDRKAAAPNAMGCPASGCAGYELDADLDFDTGTAGDRTDDEYYNGGAGWTPIGTAANDFNTEFNGNGHIISNLVINHSGNNTQAGLFGSASGSSAVVHSLGLINPSITVTAGNSVWAGALAGVVEDGGQVYGVYVIGGTVTSAGSINALGGLIGRTDDNGTLIIASYVSGATVQATAGILHDIGGLIGLVSEDSAITASYAVTSAVSGSGATGGLVGDMTSGFVDPGVITASYWDSDVYSGSSSHGAGQSKANLQGPDDYTGIYATWNVDLDNADADDDLNTGADDPWHFGSDSQYPVLQFGYNAIGVDRQRGGTGGTDYDANDNNLIDVATLAQLDAIRHDVDGSGADGLTGTGAGAGAYAHAFPGLTEGMGCPDGCEGYELTADLDFDTTGDDDVADAPYANWTPLPDYSATFDGNGRSISNLAISNSTSNASVGLFARLNGSSAIIRSVGLINPAVTGSGADQLVGALVGYQGNGSKIYAVYTSGGSVTANGRESWVGGLVGFMGSSNTSIRASYNRGTTVRGGGIDVLAGGLAGTLHNGPNITASYAAASVTNAHTTGVSNTRSAGGVTGWFGAGNSVTNSYWDTTVGPTHSGGGTGQTTSALQTPTEYGSSGIYQNWNVNVDGVAGSDDPWDFGTNSQYPILQFTYDAAGVSRQRGGTAAQDYDANDNNLIDVDALSELDAIRWDLDGDGRSVTGANALKYAAAFPNLMAGMGCPDGCAGYELAAHLDFDTDGDGDVDGNDPGSYANWAPIGDATTPYTADFNGRGYTISNLRSRGVNYVGLFGVTGADADLTGVGLPEVDIVSASGASVGALAGVSRGTVAASWSSGSVTATHTVGGLVGRNGNDNSDTASTVTSSYSTAAVRATSSSATAPAGGLAGTNYGRIVNSYAAGAVTTAGTATPGGLVGSVDTGAAITASYYNSTVQTTSNAHGAGQTTSQLQTPIAPPASGTYAGWSTDTWDFGADSDYPILKYGGNAYGIAVQRPVDHAHGNSLIDVDSLAQLNAIRWDLNGDGVVSGANAASYQAAFPGLAGCDPACTGYELTAHLDFDTDGDGATHTSGAGDAGDAYYNGGAGWVPIGAGADGVNRAYAGDFNGRNYTISNLFINSTAYYGVGLFANLDGATVESLGLVDVYVKAANISGANALWASALAGGAGGEPVAVRYSYATGAVDVTVSGTAALRAGGLVGSMSRGVIAASWSSVDVTIASTVSNDSREVAGGLVGLLNASGGRVATVLASYATGDITATRNSAMGGCVLGGLVGFAWSNVVNITASYATGAPDCTATGGASSTEGGLLGDRLAGTNLNITASYWDSTVFGTSSTLGAGQATTALQSPTGYTAPFAAWNTYNVDGDAGNTADAPWDFGTGSQYPILKMGHDAFSVSRQRGGTGSVDYDSNGNNLIDVDALAELDGIRWDLDGNGVSVTGDDAFKYAAAFPNMMAGMGCPDGCTGYELRGHLDFDENGDGEITSADDDYWNGGAGWTAIGPYTGDFHGNDYTISHLFIDASNLDNAGLFSVLSGGEYSGIGLVDADVTLTDTRGVLGSGRISHVGALAGSISHTGLRNSYSTGEVSFTHTAGASDLYTKVGGLIGGTYASGASSYTFAGLWSSATVEVDSNGSWWNDLVGGVIGQLHENSTVRASYATGSVSTLNATAGAFIGGLIGYTNNADDPGETNSKIIASYAAATLSSSNTGANIGPLRQGNTAVVTDSYWGL